MPIINVNNLTKKFKSLTAVDGISFSVNEGEVFGFLGPNGAGKSTTINILCTLLSPTAGNAEIAGYDCVKNPDEVRAAIGLIFQDTTLDTGLTAYENLKFHAYLYNLDRKLTERRIDEMLTVVELQTRKHDLIKNFSGGMKRRLEIARGLIHYPRVLFLDEPTLGLDVLARRNILRFLRDMNRERGLTVVVTSHDMDELEQLAGRIVMLHRGNIAFDGDFASLRRHASDRRVLLLETPSGAMLELVGAQRISGENGRHEFEYDARQVRLSHLLEQAAAQTQILDVETHRAPIDTLVADLYERWQRDPR
jgi:ABC-2 type transport system ATP-binding protein